jgi:dihydrofolate reductase
MKKIILDLAVTLDGFIEGPNGEIDWCIMESNGSDFEDFLAGIDTIFYGRVSYELWGNWQPDEKAGAFLQHIYKKVHSKAKYVFTKNAAFTDENATVIHSALKTRVDEIRNKGGKNIWLYGGGALITTFMNLGLIDVIRMAVHPVILGAGKPLFHGISQRVNLRLISTTTSPSGVNQLIYEVVR